MEQIATAIIKRELGITDFTCEEIVGLGQVNKVYAFASTQGKYILRLHDEGFKALEYQKEYWCLTTVAARGVPSPRVLKIGTYKGIFFMLQEKLPGINGKAAPPEEKVTIWRSLGNYAQLFHQVPMIEDAEVMQQEFHASWRHRLRYNIEQLNEQDSLLLKGEITTEEQQQMRQILETLGKKSFSTGLVHGDLCPRNTIWHQGTTYLIDWGMAEINIVPHNEIGIVLNSKTANKEEFQAFLTGLGITTAEYAQMEGEIKAINLLHHLDKYRWAEGFGVDNLEDYFQQVLRMFEGTKSY